MKKEITESIKEVTIDASGRILGRLSVEIADILRGKNKPTFVPYRLVGDKVVVINTEKIIFTGRKLINKKYQSHSMWPGGFKSMALKDAFAKDPTKVLREAVGGMLPKNRLHKNWLKNLKMYRQAKPVGE